MSYYREIRKCNGKRLRSKLYQIWHNMRKRVRGKATKRPESYDGMEIEWSNFDEFRSWALSSGFVKGMSPDRIDTSKGHTADNIRWVPVLENRLRALQDHDGVRGPEPPEEAYDEPWDETLVPDDTPWI